MDRPNFYIDEATFASLIGSGYWSIQDLSPERAEQVRPFLNDQDTLGVFASGVAPKRQVTDRPEVGGIDWVRLESHPKSGELPLNVYHFVIKKPDNIGYPVYACKGGKSIAKHHSELPDLDAYWA